MEPGKITKLKKYIFLISILFLILSLMHLIYIYIYNDAKYKPLLGGSVSEGIIGPPPHINPLKLQKGNNKYVTSFLYRSILNYDIKNNKIISDIANCNTNNLLYIECYLENNLKWSNNTSITTEDIISTYKILQTTDVNPLIKSLLNGTKIIEKENMIIFKNDKKDINFLNVLFVPIVNKKILDNIGEKELYGNFPIIGGVYSGRYVLENFISNNIRGIIEVILVKNNYYYKNKVYIEKVILKFFKTTSDFLKHKDSINIFNDKNNVLGESIPRLNKNTYTLPQYISLQINKNKIENKNLRNFLLNSINRDNLIKIIGGKFFKPVFNPYSTDIKIDKEPENKDIGELFSKLGYYKKNELLKSFLENPGNKKYSGEALIIKEKENEKENIVQTGSQIKKEITKDEILKDFGGKSKTIISPIFIDKYNFITKDNILLKGKVDKNIDAVYINNDKVGYNAGKKEFYYNLKESEDNISIGENSYKIFFEVDQNKNLQEEIFFIYNPNKGKLERDKDLFINSIIEKQKRDTIKEKEEKQEKKNINNFNQKDFNKINNLNDNLFYDKDLKPLSLKLIYVTSEKNIETTANYIKSSLFQQGIDIKITPISIPELYSIINRNKELSNNSLTLDNNEIEPGIDYDMILIGVNLGIFDFNIFPYFHSSQVKGGYNFTKFKKNNLDILLEELKSNNLSKKEISVLQKKVLNILKDEQIIKILYTPIINNLVDKNIKDYFIPTYLPNKSTRVQSLYNSYILEEKFINLDNKTIYNFLKFLYKTINE